MKIKEKQKMIKKLSQFLCRHARGRITVGANRMWLYCPDCDYNSVGITIDTPDRIRNKPRPETENKAFVDTVHFSLVHIKQINV
jgi:hypothetical protein